VIQRSAAKLLRFITIRIIRLGNAHPRVVTPPKAKPILDNVGLCRIKPLVCLQPRRQSVAENLNGPTTPLRSFDPATLQLGKMEPCIQSGQCQVTAHRSASIQTHGTPTRISQCISTPIQRSGHRSRAYARRVQAGWVLQACRERNSDWRDARWLGFWASWHEWFRFFRLATAGWHPSAFFIDQPCNEFATIECGHGSTPPVSIAIPSDAYLDGALGAPNRKIAGLRAIIEKHPTYFPFDRGSFSMPANRSDLSRSRTSAHPSRSACPDDHSTKTYTVGSLRGSGSIVAAARCCKHQYVASDHEAIHPLVRSELTLIKLARKPNNNGVRELLRRSRVKDKPARARHVVSTRRPTECAGLDLRDRDESAGRTRSSFNLQHAAFDDAE